MRFLITGGAGFIGSHIAEGLLESGRGEVIVVDNLKVGKIGNIPKGCRFYRCDIADKKKLAGLFKSVDVVFHNAAFVSIRGSFNALNLREEIETNCVGTLNVLEASAKGKVKKVIFASSMAVYGQPQYLPVDEKHPTLPISPYGLSKLRGEFYCRIFNENLGIPTVILRYFNTYGVRQTPSDYVGVITTFINQLINKKPITIFGDGQQTRDFVSVKDVVQANLSAAFCDASGIYNVASGEDLAIGALADLIIRSFGRGKQIYQDKPSGEIDKIRANVSRITQELNFSPKENIKQSLPAIIDWWKHKED